jgi:hypothetical protein
VRYPIDVGIVFVRLFDFNVK